MPRFSTFTRFGYLRFSSKPSGHELAYRATVAAIGEGTYDTTPGTHVEASVYCRSQARARAMGLLERAKNQHDPAKCLECLPAQEANYRIVPPPNATIQERRDTLVARAKLNRGAVRENVEDQLRTLLGSYFEYYKVVDQVSYNPWPSSPGTGPGVYTRYDLPPRTVQILGGTTAIGTPTWVSYGNLDPNAESVVLKPGDEVCVNAGDLENAERVIVTGEQTTSYGVHQFQATFTKYHGYGFIVRTGPFPAQMTTGRFAFIVISGLVSLNQHIRDQIGEIMRRVARGVSQWCVVHRTGPNVTGPYVIDGAALGHVPFGAITVP